jgi:hypothetical protein
MGIELDETVIARPWASADQRIPLPLATAGIGLLFAWLAPGGLSGGVGFLIGFAAGVVVLLLTARSRTGTPTRTMARALRCPNCGHALRIECTEYRVSLVTEEPGSATGGRADA